MQAVIFDMDGVIIDSEPVHQRLEIEMLEELGGSISTEEYLKFVGTTDDYMWSHFKEMYDLEPSVEDLIATKKQRFMEEIQQVPLVDHFLDVLKAFDEAGYRLALASSNNRKTVDHIVDQFSLGDYFDVTMSGEDITHGKPHPEIFLHTAEVMGIEPTECLVFEDAANGVAAAKEAGMQCVALDNPNSGVQDLSQADVVLDDFVNFNLDELLTELNE